jgi:hypothetical protein
MSGRRASRRCTQRSSSSLASARPARSRSSRMAVAKRGSAKIITPAADWIRWAQVREPTTRKERILNLAVQPHDAGEAAEHLALAAFAQHGRRAAAGGWMQRHDGVHAGTPCDRAASASACLPRRAQLQDELRGIDAIGGVGRQGQQHLAACAQRAGVQRHQVGRVQRQHQHAEHVFPEEGRRKQPAVEDHLLPDAAGDHDGVEQQRLDNDRKRGGSVAFTAAQVAQHQHQADRRTPGTARGASTACTIVQAAARRGAAFCSGVYRLPGSAVSVIKSLVAAINTVRLGPAPKNVNPGRRKS